jgi:hypothetical protein
MDTTRPSSPLTSSSLWDAGLRADQASAECVRVLTQILHGSSLLLMTLSPAWSRLLHGHLHRFPSRRGRSPRPRCLVALGGELPAVVEHRGRHTARGRQTPSRPCKRSSKPLLSLRRPSRRDTYGTTAGSFPDGPGRTPPRGPQSGPGGWCGAVDVVAAWCPRALGGRSRATPAGWYPPGARV